MINSPNTCFSDITYDLQINNLHSDQHAACRIGPTTNRGQGRGGIKKESAQSTLHVNKQVPYAATFLKFLAVKLRRKKERCVSCG